MIELKDYSLCDECAAVVPDFAMNTHEYFHVRFEELFDKVWEIQE